MGDDSKYVDDDLWCRVCAKDIPPGEGICEMCACDMGKLRDNKQAVYDAAMDWYNACQESDYYDIGQTGDALDKLFVVCRRAKEGE